MQTLPSCTVVALDDLAPSGGIAIVAPHPDDETLGCGGLIALALAQGRAVTVIVVTDGSASHPGSLAYPPRALARLREGELMQATAALGLEASDLISLGLPDGGLDRLAPCELSDRLAAVLAGRNVETVFSPGVDDTHPDHRAVYAACRTAARRRGCRLWTYPIRAHVMAGLEGRLAMLDISAVVALKRRAIGCYASQFGGVISDDSAGFQLTAEDRAIHSEPYELFVRAPLGSPPT